MRSITYRDETGEIVEIVEHDAEGRPIARTYADRRAPDQADAAAE